MNKTIKTIFLTTGLVLTLVACGSKDNYEIKTACPSGAPLMAISYAYNADDKNLFIVEDTTTFPQIFQKNEEDIIIAPVNLGVKLYNASKSTYKLQSVVTWGNTFFASQKENFKLEDINGNDITLFGATSINDAVAKYVLEKKNIVPTNFLYPDPDVVGGANQVLLTKPEAFVMTAEPALTVAKSKKSITSYSIADLYTELTNHKCPQAAVFVKEESYKLHKDAFNNFFNKIKEACDDSKNKPASVAQKSHDLGIEQTVEVLTAAIPNCNLNYVTALNAKADVNFAATEFTSYFTKAPADDFYLL